MPKAFTVSGMVVSILLILIFGLDLALKMPFGRISLWMDIGFALSGAILGYLSWSAFRELR